MLSIAQSIPSRVGYGLLSPMISITSKSAKLRNPSILSGTWGNQPSGDTLCWLASHRCIGDLDNLGLPIYSHVCLVITFTSDPKSRITSSISNSPTCAMSHISLPVLVYPIILWTTLLTEEDGWHWSMMRWSSPIAFSFLVSFKQLCRKDCTLPVDSSSSRLPDVVACDICTGLTPHGVCCGMPLDGCTYDLDCVGSLKKFLASWNVSLFFYRSSDVALLGALRTHCWLAFFSIACDVPLVEAPLRFTILTLGSGSTYSATIS